MSGHSKWSQIKHKKALTDAKKGKTFSKMAKEVSVAAKTGGGNPDMNPRLRTAIERARAAGLPKDNIDRAIQKAIGGESVQELQEFLYEALGPGGFSIIIEGITDNKNRTINELRLILSRHGGKLAGQGSLIWNFSKVGVIVITNKDNQQKNQDKTEELIIESGALDFTIQNGGWLIETNFNELEIVKQRLENLGIKIKESGHDYIPKTVLEITSAENKAAEILLEALEDHDDVQEIYTNLSK